MERSGKRISYGVLMLLMLVMAVIFWIGRNYLMVSFALMGLTFIPFYARFENKKMEAEEIVLIASLSAIAAIGRVPFAALPGIQPTSFMIIMSGILLGPETGFIIGSTTGLVSNIFLGQGPWTPWQMLAWGLMGFTAGIFRRQKWFKHRLGLTAFGFGWGFLFGWILNLWFVLGFFEPLSRSVWLSAFTASFYFDLSHALANMALIFFFAKRWEKILGRIIEKFGLLTRPQM